MGVGMASRPGVESVARRLMRDYLLAVARHRVIFGIGAEHRLPFAPGRQEGGGHVAAALLDSEAFGSQQVDVGLG